MTKIPSGHGGGKYDLTIEVIKPMTKIPSVEEAIEQIGIATYGGRSFEPTGLYREKLTKILNAQRTALLTELREYTSNLKGVYSAHDVQEAIKAHLDELIKSNSV